MNETSNGLPLQLTSPRPAPNPWRLVVRQIIPIILFVVISYTIWWAIHDAFADSPGVMSKTCCMLNQAGFSVFCTALLSNYSPTLLESLFIGMLTVLGLYVLNRALKIKGWWLAAFLATTAIMFFEKVGTSRLVGLMPEDFFWFGLGVTGPILVGLLAPVVFHLPNIVGRRSEASQNDTDLHEATTSEDVNHPGSIASAPTLFFQLIGGMAASASVVLSTILYLTIPIYSIFTVCSTPNETIAWARFDCLSEVPASEWRLLLLVWLTIMPAFGVWYMGRLFSQGGNFVTACLASLTAAFVWLFAVEPAASKVQNFSPYIILLLCSLAAYAGYWIPALLKRKTPA